MYKNGYLREELSFVSLTDLNKYVMLQTGGTGAPKKSVMLETKLLYVGNIAFFLSMFFQLYLNLPNILPGNENIASTLHVQRCNAVV